MSDYYGRSLYPSSYYDKNVYQDPYQSYTYSQNADFATTTVYPNAQSCYQIQDDKIQCELQEFKETRKQHDRLKDMLQDFNNHINELKRQQDFQAHLDELAHQAHIHEQVVEEMHKSFRNQLAEERRHYEELLVEREQQYEVRCQKYEEGFERKFRAHEEFHDKELQDQKIIIRRLETSYKNLKDDQIQNSSSPGFLKQEKEEPLLQQILSYSKLIPAAQSILKIPIQHVKEVCNFDFPSFNNFLPEQQVEEEECNPPQEVSHLEGVDSFQGSFDLFNELPGFVSEQEDEVHTPQEKNQSLLMLISEQQEEDNDLTTLIIQDSPNKVCNGPLPGKIENNDDASFWDDLEAFITDLDIPHISTEKTNPVQKIVIGENVMETLDQGDLMVENFGDTKCIAKPTGLPSFDQQHQVYEMIPLPFDSLEFNSPNQFDVILERKDEKVKIRKSELGFVITRGCPIGHCARMDLKPEASDIKEKLPPAYASQTCVNFDRFQEVGEPAYYFQNMFQVQLIVSLACYIISVVWMHEIYPLLVRKGSYFNQSVNGCI